MIRVFRGGVIGLMAVDAFNTQRPEEETVGRCVGMTIKAVGGLMGSGKRKTAFPMNVRDVGYHPVDGAVAPGTIGPHSLVVNIGVAIHALFSGFAEIQGLMALPATDGLMLPQKGEPGFAMIKGQGFKVNFPTGRIVTILAGQPELLSVWRLLSRCCQ